MSNLQLELWEKLNEGNSLIQVQEYIRKVIELRGFSEQNIEKTMLLLTEEVGELAKAIRKDKTSMSIDMLKIKNYDTIESEVADVFIVLCSICNKLNIDLFSSLKDKEKENIEIKYFSDASTRQNFINELKSKRKLDIIKGFTTKGVHHDDFLIYLNDKQVNIYGSQGQHRTAMLSLKLSELQVIYDDIGEYPILLLDDFMSELDEKRRKNFLENIKNIQVIITCTDKIVLENLNYFLYNVVDGKIIEKEK